MNETKGAWQQEAAQYHMGECLYSFHLLAWPWACTDRFHVCNSERLSPCTLLVYEIGIMSYIFMLLYVLMPRTIKLLRY